MGDEMSDLRSKIRELEKANEKLTDENNELKRRLNLLDPPKAREDTQSSDKNNFGEGYKKRSFSLLESQKN